MSIPNITGEDSGDAKKFPFTRLIWPVFILLVLFMFRNPIEQLLIGSDDVAVEVLGVKIKIAKSDIEELGAIQKEFEAEINSLNDTINQQNAAMKELARMNDELAKKAKDCPEVNAATKQFSKGVDDFLERNSELKSKANVFKGKKLFKIPAQVVADSISTTGN